MKVVVCSDAITMTVPCFNLPRAQLETSSFSPADQLVFMKSTTVTTRTLREIEKGSSYREFDFNIEGKIGYKMTWPGLFKAGLS